MSETATSDGCGPQGCGSQRCGDPEADWTLHLRRAVVSQFGHPRGGIGRLAGFIMAHRRSNVERSLWTVSLLDIKPSDRVLEIGPGPGIAIAEASGKAALVVGLDHSEAMVRQAARRNCRAIRKGRVRLVHGSFDKLTPEEGPFDKIFAVNSINFWSEPAENLKTLVAVLRVGGILAITEQPRSLGATEATSQRAAQRISRMLDEAGLKDLEVEKLPLGSVPAVCVLGRC